MILCQFATPAGLPPVVHFTCLLCPSVCRIHLLAVCAFGVPAAMCHGRSNERMNRADGEGICRSPPNQGIDSRSLSPNHHSAVWLRSRRGSPFVYVAHSRIWRSPGGVQSPSGPATTPTPAVIDILIPSPSCNLRRRTFSGSSPGSTLPPGNSHKPVSPYGYERWAARARSLRGERTKTATTTMNADIPFTMLGKRSPCTAPRHRGLSGSTMLGTDKGRTMSEPWLNGHEPPVCNRAIRAPTGYSGRTPNSSPE